MSRELAVAHEMDGDEKGSAVPTRSTCTSVAVFASADAARDEQEKLARSWV